MSTPRASVAIPGNALPGAAIGDVSGVAYADRAYAALQWTHAMQSPARWVLKHWVDMTVVSKLTLLLPSMIFGFSNAHKEASEHVPSFCLCLISVHQWLLPSA